MIPGFIAGVALGQKLVGMTKSKSTPISAKNSNTQRISISANVSTAQRLQSAKLAALKRMQARKLEEQKKFAAKKIANEAILATSQSGKNFSRSFHSANVNASVDKTIVEDAMIDAAIDYELKDNFKGDASGQLLKSIRNSLRELNFWIKDKSAGLLDLNVTLAIFFIIRGIRKFLIEKQYPNAWQLIWWASSILRGWRFM